ncbi:unnamed protein product [Amaranthus hypochondriacus]
MAICTTTTTATFTVFSVLVLIVNILPRIGLQTKIYGFHLERLMSSNINGVLPSPHRKLLAPKRIDKPTRFWDDTNQCSESDIEINQGPGAPLASGIPTYTVEIVNACMSGCDITGIHLRCGWFSSAHTVDPFIFRRLRYDNCLFNNGGTLQHGKSISFQYANSYSYPLSVLSIRCL